MEPEPHHEDPLGGIEVEAQPNTQQAPEPTEEQSEKKLSKAQQKKLRNRQKWQQARRVKKIRKKEARRQKAEKQKPLKVDKPQTEKQFVPQRRRKQEYQEKVQKGLRVIIDLQFFSQMTDKEKNSLFKQLTHCHSTNRRMEQACCLIITSTEGEADEILTKKYNAQNWGITIQPKHFLDCYPLESLVYLTGDAEEELTDLQQDKVYLIGGLVDHNRLKKITYNYALEHKIRMARFPLDKYVDLKSNCHLAVNHVFEILVKVYNGMGWEKAVKESIPNRKLNAPEEEEKW